jgi:hypothetical protein
LVAAIKLLVLLPQCRSDHGAGDFADASLVVIASGKPYLIDANTI